MKAEELAGLPIMLLEKASDWEKWLEANFAQTGGVWLKHAKKASGKASVSYVEALEAAICWGWIDGQKQTYDEQYFLQKYTPRRAKSVWSKINVDRVAALTAAGRMKPSGLVEVERAKADGRWDQAYDGARTMTEAEDFAAALEANPQAKAFYATLNKTSRYAFNYRIQSAKKPETRQARIEKFITMLNEGKVIY